MPQKTINKKIFNNRYFHFSTGKNGGIMRLGHLFYKINLSDGGIEYMLDLYFANRWYTFGYVRGEGYELYEGVALCSN